MNGYVSVCERYRKLRAHSRELLEEEAFHALRMRVDVAAIDDDILRRVKRDWAAHPERLVAWDWERGIIGPLRRKNARFFDLALLVRGQLCGLAAVRMSNHKRWLSLTHVEGAPGEHPLKGKVLPLVINAMYIYRGAVCRQGEEHGLGIRVLNPLDEALPCYQNQGYSLSVDSKRLRSIEIEPRTDPESLGVLEKSDGKPAAES